MKASRIFLRYVLLSFFWILIFIFVKREYISGNSLVLLIVGFLLFTFILSITFLVCKYIKLTIASTSMVMIGVVVLFYLIFDRPTFIFGFGCATAFILSVISSKVTITK